MRTFDIRCNSCGDFDDVPLDAPTGRMSVEDMKWQPKCPQCDQVVAVIIPPVLTVGPMESKPINLKSQIGYDITSNKQWREYKKKNPTARPVSKTDQNWKDHYSEVRELADVRAQKQGYNGFYDKRERKRKEKIAAGKSKP